MNDWRSEEDERIVYRGRVTTLVRLALVAFVLVVVLLLWFVLSPPESRGVIYVQAPDGAVKAVPVDPGGYRAEDRGVAVYKLVDNHSQQPYQQPGRMSKEMTVVRPRPDANNYYSIHSDVVNIYTDEETQEEKAMPCQTMMKQHSSTQADLDLATFKTREQAVRMLRHVAKDSEYADIAKMCKDKVVIIQKRIAGKRRYSVTVVDLPEDEAHRLCRTLKSRGKGCLVRR